MPKEIIIEIDENAQITLEAIGYTGKSCHVDLEELAKVLGQKVSETKKAEYYQQKVKATQKTKG